MCFELYDKLTGSLNSIRVWNTKTGHAITRMSVTKRDQETIVWCLAVLSDNIIVSGDSHGRLSFWDGALGDQVNICSFLSLSNYIMIKKMEMSFSESNL